MSSISEIHHTRPVGRFGPTTPAHKWAVLPEDDHRQLQWHMEQCNATQHPAGEMLAHVLYHKIRTTEPVSDVRLRDLVTGGCRVTYSVDRGPLQTGLLVHRARSTLGGGVIPVCSLLGATLIGMRTGQRAPLLCDDGTIVTVAVIGVEQPT